MVRSPKTHRIFPFGVKLAEVSGGHPGLRLVPVGAPGPLGAQPPQEVDDAGACCSVTQRVPDSWSIKAAPELLS